MWKVKAQITIKAEVGKEAEIRKEVEAKVLFEAEAEIGIPEKINVPLLNTDIDPTQIRIQGQDHEASESEVFQIPMKGGKATEDQTKEDPTRLIQDIRKKQAEITLLKTQVFK